MGAFRCTDCGAVMVPGTHMPHHLDDCMVRATELLIGAPKTDVHALQRAEAGRPAYSALLTACELDLGPRRTYAKQLEEARPYRRRPIAEPWSDWDAFGWDCIACGEESEERTASHAQVRAVLHNRMRHPRRMRRT